TLSPRGVPLVGFAVAYVVGLLLMLPFGGWQEFVGFITAAYVMGYAFAPLSLVAMRRQHPDHARPYRLRGASVLAPVAFVVSNLLVYWTGWTNIWKLMVVIGFGPAIFAIGQLRGSGRRVSGADLRASM